VDTFLAHQPGPGAPHGPAPMTARTEATHARWQQGLSRLRAYAQTHGAANPPTRAVVDGFRLGRWAAVQRERYWANRLPPDHLTTLQGVPGWDWGRTNADRWSEGLTHLQSYLDEHGTTAVDTRTVHQGFALGAWVARRRSNYHQGTLSPTRSAALEAITGWEWNPYDAAWRRMFQHVEQAVHHHGSVAHITQTAVIDGVNVGHWVMDQRTRYRQGRLRPDRVSALEALPGWDWAPRAHQRSGAGGEPANTK